VQGKCTHLERECHNSIFRIWCGAHQIDTRRQESLEAALQREIREQVDSSNSPFASPTQPAGPKEIKVPNLCNHSVDFDGKFTSMVEKVKLEEHFNEKLPACRPTREWWLLVSIIQPLVERIEKTFFLSRETIPFLHDERQQFNERVLFLGCINDEHAARRQRTCLAHE
jgi:hypothetical protein